jgi:hypothetical protein
MSDATAVRDTAKGHPDTSTIFVLGLFGLSGAFVFSGCAWYFGNRLLAKYDAEPGRWGRRGWVTAGRNMGIIGLAIFVLWFFVLVMSNILS